MPVAGRILAVCSTIDYRNYTRRATIEVDGKNIFDDIHAWQRNIGYIPQVIYLMDDTIRRNVCFGVPDGEVDEHQLWTVIEAAQLRELVETLYKVGELL